MKKLILSFIAIAILSLSSFSQSPQGFKYQAVVRDAGNLILNNQAVGIRMTIQQGSIGGTTVYSETFATTSNAYGLVNLEIGSGTVTSGTFASIDWSAGPYFIETAVDVAGGTSYTVMGTSQLMSVPYALHANTAENVSNDLVDDADADPTNELQNWSNLPDIPANIDIDATDDFSGDYTDLSNQPTIPIVPTNVSAFANDAGYVTTSNDADADATNEIQTLTLSGSDLSISGGNTITLPSSLTGSKPIFRWTTFSTYNQAYGWYANNDPNMFGGINPSTWSDANGIAANMSSDKQILLTLFNKTLSPGNNAVVYANEWLSYSSTNGQFAGALFRIENTTGSDIVWNAQWYSTAYAGWGERSSVTINGIDVWNSGASNFFANHHESTAITIPANRTSTIIFISASSVPSGNSRGTYLAFDQNCLNLPAGLKMVDDLDSAPNGWGF